MTAPLNSNPISTLFLTYHWSPRTSSTKTQKVGSSTLKYLEFGMKANPPSTITILTKARIAKTQANVLNQGQVAVVVTCIILAKRRMLKMKVMMRRERVTFILWTKLAVGLCGILLTNISISQNRPRIIITTMNCAPKVAGKLLLLTPAKLKYCQPTIPPPNLFYLQLTSTTICSTQKTPLQTPSPMANMKKCTATISTATTSKISMYSAILASQMHSKKQRCELGEAQAVQEKGEEGSWQVRQVGSH